MNRTRSLVVAALVAGFTLTTASTASAELIGVYGPIKDETAGRKGQFQADVYTNRKGVPVRASAIQLQWLDTHCISAGGHPFLVDNFEFDLPAVKVRRKSGRFVISTSEGGVKVSARISRNGQRLRGRISVHEHYNDGDLAGSTCVARTTFKAKSVYLY